MTPIKKGERSPVVDLPPDLVVEGAGHVLLDTSDDEDVAVVAGLAARLDLPVVASDPLIVELVARLADATDVTPPPAPPRGRSVVLAGSTGLVVMDQLAAFAQHHPVLTLDLLDPRGAEGLVGHALEWAAGQCGSLAISTATGATGLARSQSALGPMGAARMAEDILARVAKGLHDAGHRRFVVAGGETSGAVVAALGLRHARALPEGPLGLGCCLSESDDPVWMFLKPGKLGADDILLRAVATEGETS